MAYEDLLKDSSSPLDNKNYFNLTITDLNISTLYPLEFRWKYEDGTFSSWSVVKSITTPGESFPNVPSTLTVAADTAGYLEITWNGNSSTGAALTNFDRVDVYINGGPFDSSKAALSFFSAGTKTIVAPAGTYIVSSFAVSKIGTLSAMSTAVTRTITSAVPAALASATPSTPTVSSVLGAIQVSWDGKQSDNSPQPYGFNAAKVYVGTSAGFTPSASNQVDILNFANGQNTLNIGVGTIVNSVALTYGVDYYVKIATTNGTDTSTAVSATGNPVQIGKVTSGDIVTINADKIATGTLDVGSTITVGSTAGKHVVIAGTGDPLTIYGSGGVPGGAILSFNGAKLSIVGDGTFSGDLAIGSTSTASVFKAEPATGIWLGNQSYASAPFSVAVNGVIKANSGTIGGWTLGATFLQGTNFEINSSNSTIFVGSAAGQHIRISASGGIATYNGATQVSGFDLTTSGSLTLSGTLTAASGSSIGGWTTGSTTITGGLTTLNSNGTITVSGTSVTTSINGSTGIITINDSLVGGPYGGGLSLITSSGSTSYGSGGISWAYGSDTSAIYQESPGGSLRITAGAAQTVNITSDGGSLGSAYPIYLNAGKIEMAGSISALGSATFGSSGSLFEFLSTSGNVRVAQTYNNDMGGTTRAMRVSTAGMYGYVSSTRRRKEQINNYSINSQALLSLPVRKFKYIDDETDIQQYGFIAEEAQELGLDELIQYDSTGIPDYFAYETLPIFLLQIIQEQDASIKSLESRLDALEG
jgi:hypothetical protein